jgi:hypothetical protein
MRAWGRESRPGPEIPAGRGPEPSAWAVGGLVFAACALTLVGAFQVIAALTAIFDDNFDVVARATRSTSTRRPGAGST